MKSLSAIIFFSSAAEKPFSRRAELLISFVLTDLAYLSDVGVALAVFMKLAFVYEGAWAIFQNPGGVFWRAADFAKVRVFRDNCHELHSVS
jgi:hypothetical protein